MPLVTLPESSRGKLSAVVVLLLSHPRESDPIWLDTVRSLPVPTVSKTVFGNAKWGSRRKSPLFSNNYCCHKLHFNYCLSLFSFVSFLEIFLNWCISRINIITTFKFVFLYRTAYWFLRLILFIREMRFIFLNTCNQIIYWSHVFV